MVLKIQSGTSLLLTGAVSARHYLPKANITKRLDEWRVEPEESYVSYDVNVKDESVI